MPHTWLLEAYEKLKQTNEGKQCREKIFFLNYNTNTVEKRRENMDWVNAIEKAIQYIENHLVEDITVKDVAKYVHISEFYFQKGFAMLCGFTISEYIRKRRLSLAGNEIAGSDIKIIDIAIKYGYDSPDSFTKAFTRFHGVTPTVARKKHTTLKSFAPLKLTIALEGGYLMDYKIERKKAFKVIANEKRLLMKMLKKSFLIFGKSIIKQVKEKLLEEFMELTLINKWGKKTLTI